MKERKKAMYRIGVDLGGTNIAAGLVDENYNIIRKDSVPTRAQQRSIEAIIDDISALCLKICADEGISISEIEAIGIASPGIANHTDGYVEYSNNIHFSHTPICEMVSKGTGVKSVHVENDANAAAWGEAVAGAARGTTNSVMITLGTGVGGGIIIDGKVYSGFNYAGAELGHIVIEQGGRQCSCGRRGCWEAYSSATGLINMTNEKLAECAAKGEKTVMTELVEKKGRVTGRTAFDAMRLGDNAGKEVVDEYLKYLACGITNIVNIFQPEIISIGGGISGEGQSLIDAIEPMVRAEQYGSRVVALTQLKIAELGNDAGIIGAAFLGI